MHLRIRIQRCIFYSLQILELADIQLSHAEKMKLGTRKYELVTLTKEPPKRHGASED